LREKLPKIPFKNHLISFAFVDTFISMNAFTLIGLTTISFFDPKNKSSGLLKNKSNQEFCAVDNTQFSDLLPFCQVAPVPHKGDCLASIRLATFLIIVRIFMETLTSSAVAP